MELGRQAPPGYEQQPHDPQQHGPRKLSGVINDQATTIAEHERGPSRRAAAYLARQEYAAGNRPEGCSEIPVEPVKT
jgi:hypothetical protein